jgi:hypothetical protein
MAPPTHRLKPAGKQISLFTASGRLVIADHEP